MYQTKPSTANKSPPPFPYSISSQVQMSFRYMNPTRSKSKTCFFSLLISFSFLISYTDRSTGWSSILIRSIVPVIGALILVALVVVAARATVVAWITVLVLLAFAGKRRRVLVAQGKKITSEVAMYFIKVVIKERSGMAAVACATVLSLVAMSCFKNAWYIGPTVILE